MGRNVIFSGGTQKNGWVFWAVLVVEKRKCPKVTLDSNECLTLGRWFYILLYPQSRAWICFFAMRRRSLVRNESHDLRKIPFHYSCSLWHGHCRYHLIPAIHSWKDPFNPMTMRFRSDHHKNPRICNDYIKVLVCFGDLMDLKVVLLICHDRSKMRKICLKSLEDFCLFSETFKVHSYNSWKTMPVGPGSDSN